MTVASARADLDQAERVLAEAQAARDRMRDLLDRALSAIRSVGDEATANALSRHHRGEPATVAGRRWVPCTMPVGPRQIKPGKHGWAGTAAGAGLAP